jgi:hypothetical protein
MKILCFLMLILPVLPALAQEEENLDNPKEAAVEPVVEAPVKPAAVLYEPYSRKDPFFRLAPPKTTARKADADEEIKRGTAPPGIGGTLIHHAGLEGIVIRSDNRRMVIIRGADDKAYFLREGDRLFDGYLKTIEDDSVVFVRETFMRSGKILTQEVTKRLRES